MSGNENLPGDAPVTEEEVRQLVSLVVDEVMAVKDTSTPDNGETIAIGADHGGFQLKQSLIEHLEGQGLAIHDCGCTSTDAVDYPDFAHAVANLVGTGVCRWGVIVDGAGIMLNIFNRHARRVSKITEVEHRYLREGDHP